MLEYIKYWYYNIIFSIPCSIIVYIILYSLQVNINTILCSRLYLYSIMYMLLSSICTIFVSIILSVEYGYDMITNFNKLKFRAVPSMSHLGYTPGTAIGILMGIKIYCLYIHI